MGVSLKKGGNVSLSKIAPDLKKISVGLGWNARTTSGAAFDLDACAFMLNGDTVRSDTDFIFYNQLRSSCGSVEHQGDNRTGEGDGDDEIIKVNLDKLPNNVSKIVFTVTIHEGLERGQNFGQVNDAYVRVLNDEDGSELARYDLTEDAATIVSMIFCEIYRHGSEWKLRAVGQGFEKGLESVARNFGVSVD